MTDRTITPPDAGDLVRVWDPFLRIFHWLLATLILLAWLTADETKTLHEAIGYAIAILIALRVVWGFVGPASARFSNFIRGPKATARYLNDLAHGRERRYLGHNPAGAAMIATLLAVVAGTVLTGWLMLTDRFWGSEAMEEAHEALAIVILVLVAVHVGGVIVESLRHRENLILAMIDGKKRREDQ